MQLLRMSSGSESGSECHLAQNLDQNQSLDQNQNLDQNLAQNQNQNLAQNVIWMTESDESFLGPVSMSQPSQESFRGGSDAGGGIDSAAFLQQ